MEIAQEIVVSFGITWKLVVATKVEGMDRSCEVRGTVSEKRLGLGPMKFAHMNVWMMQRNSAINLSNLSYVYYVFN